MNHNTSLNSIKKHPDNTTVLNPIPQSSIRPPPFVDPSPFTILDSIDFLLKVVKDVDSQLEHQTRQLRDIQTDIDLIDAVLSDPEAGVPENAPFARFKGIRKARRRVPAFELLMNSSSDLIDNKTEVEVRILGFGKKLYRNREYKRLFN